tara:strand:+ start:322 stop:618 length:297 start_codon:yes stop_codon:yes gene_type:complete
MNMLPDGYIKRTTSTIPFGYEYDEITGYLKPIEEELEALLTVENMIVNEEVSLQTAVDWLEYETGRKISTPGLKKHIDKKYGTRIERLGRESSSLLAR